MKSRFFIIFLIVVLFFSSLGACLAYDNSQNESSNSQGYIVESKAKTSQDTLDKEIIAGLIALGNNPTTIAINRGYGDDNAAISKLYSEMRRLGFTEDQIAQLAQLGSNGLFLKKGVIYKNNKAIGLWTGTDAYTLNSAGKLVKSSSSTKQVKEAITIGQTLSSKQSLSTTSKIVKFVNNVASNKVINSGVYSLANVYTKANKGSLALKLLAADIITNNLGVKKFTGSNVYISTNAIKSVLNDEFSKKFIARKSIKVSSLKTALAKGKAILQVKKQDNKWHFISISKVSSKKVTVYDNKKSQKVAISSLTPYLSKNKYRFSGVAITYNVKIGQTPSTANLKAAIGI
ncbi:MAG: hypothetical protein LBU74_02080 [Methanobacteriaceae archaeon]|jgi:Holliday junction resolvase|nr:hypothetical protein [Candidatus Methanorudis spinitermitis]